MRSTSFRSHPLACTLFLAAIVLPRLCATDYYLGSLAAMQPGVPVADLAALNALTLKPGDRVFLQGGETFSGTLSLGSEDAGTAAAPVIITSYGVGRATIASGTSSGIKIYNAAGFAVSRIDLQGSDRATSKGSGLDAGVYLPTSTRLPYLRFSEMRISGYKNGVEMWAWYDGSTTAYPGFEDVKLTAIEAFGNRSEGIKTWGSWRAHNATPQYSHRNVTIEHCSVWDNRGDPASTSHTGSGIIVSGVDQGVVQYCVAHDNGGSGPTTGGGPYGIWAWEARGVVLQYNLVYNQKSSSGLDGGAYDLDGGSAGCTVQYNYSYNNQGPGLALIQFSGGSIVANNVFRYNISENDCRKNNMGVIYVGQFSTIYGVNGAEIYGNTIYVSANSGGGRPAAAAVQNQANIANVRLRNNIFQATHTGSLIGGVTSTPTKALYQGNDYWGGVFDLAAFRTKGQETVAGVATGFRVDPQLACAGGGGTVTDVLALPAIAAYGLKSTSPLIGAGLDLLTRFGVDPGPKDFYGAALCSTALDVGAAVAPAAQPPQPEPQLDPQPEVELPVVIIDDQFNGTGSLGGRTPDTVASGRKWATEAGTVTLANGVASANTSIRNVIETEAADCTVASSVTLTTSGTGLVLRNSNSSNFLRLMLTATSVQLYKTQAGVTTSVGSIARALPLGQTYALSVVLNGPTLTISINGTSVGSFTTSFNQTATRHGLLSNGSGVRSWGSFTVQR